MLFNILIKIFIFNFQNVYSASSNSNLSVDSLNLKQNKLFEKEELLNKFAKILLTDFDNNDLDNFENQLSEIEFKLIEIRTKINLIIDEILVKNDEIIKLKEKTKNEDDLKKLQRSIKSFIHRIVFLDQKKKLLKKEYDEYDEKLKEVNEKIKCAIIINKITEINKELQNLKDKNQLIRN